MRIYWFEHDEDASQLMKDELCLAIHIRPISTTCVLVECHICIELITPTSALPQAFLEEKTRHSQASDSHHPTGPERPSLSLKMSGVNDGVPAYRLNKGDLERYLRRKWPDHGDFKIELSDDQYNIFVPRYLERAELDEISKLRKPVPKRRPRPK